MRIVLPKTFVEIDNDYGPVFFLAGPIKGGNDWQYRVVKEIERYYVGFYAVLPNRYKNFHPLMLRKINGNENKFERQTSWERHYLNIASNLGCIIFWLPAEDKLNPRKDGEVYARDTRGELGEWRGRMMHNKDLKVVIGAEEDFPGLSQIQRNFNEALNIQFPIYKTLSGTVEAAIDKSMD